MLFKISSSPQTQCQTICDRGGPAVIAYFGPGGPNFTPDQILRDRPTLYHKPNIKSTSTFYLLLDNSNPKNSYAVLWSVCQISKPDSSRNQRNKNSKKLKFSLSMLLLFLFVMSQTSYNLVTSAPMLIP